MAVNPPVIVPITFNESPSTSVIGVTIIEPPNEAVAIQCGETGGSSRMVTCSCGGICASAPVPGQTATPRRSATIRAKRFMMDFM